MNIYMGKKVNFHKKKIKGKFKSSTLHVYLLIIFILCSVILSIIIFQLNKKLSLKLDNTMTAYLAIIGSLPTVYLWIVKERKKEEELKNKQQEINQIKVSELNKVYVDAVNQFYNEKTFIAGAYALLALVDDWINMSREYDEKAKDYFPRVSQISSVIFSAQKNKCDNELFNSIIIELVLKITMLEKNNNNFSFNWSKVSLKKLTISHCDLSYARLVGVEIVDSEFIGVNMNKINFKNATLTNNDFTFENLSYANLRNTNLSNSKFVGSFLDNADLSAADLQNADLFKAILTDANIKGANFSNANLDSAELTGVKMIRY